MRRWMRAALLGCAGLAACGGRLDGETHAAAGASSAGAAAGGAPAGGSPDAGGSVSDGGLVSGAGGVSAPACSGDSGVVCAASCGSEQATTVLGECRDGTWSCPAPLVAFDSCPPDACVRQAVTCCDHQYGRRTLAPCAPTGRFGACPAGFERDAAICVADSAHTTDCSTLFDKSCTLEDALCELHGVYCRCVSQASGLGWQCVVDVL